MIIAACTQKGLHAENEDRVIVGNRILDSGSLKTELVSGIIAVADGVGGNKAGAAAAQFLSENLTKMDHLSPEVFESINNELIRLSGKDPDLEGMAATLSGVQLGADLPPVFHVGNTRVWVISRNAYLKQITNDDTTMNYLLTVGTLSLEDVDSYDHKSEITACFGGGDPNLLQVKFSRLEPDHPIIITSDGVHDYLSLDEMEEVLTDTSLSLEERCAELIRLADNAGSPDDKSVIIAAMPGEFCGENEETL